MTLEAWTGVPVGRAIELRKTQNQDADSFLMEEGTTADSR
jgi:hypothetical protein